MQYIFNTFLSLCQQLINPFFHSIATTDFPGISPPFRDPGTGLPVILIASPICDKSGKNLGYLAGSIALSHEHFLEGMMRYRIGNGGYLYIFDLQRNIIFHPDQQRILTARIPTGSNPLLDQAIQGFNGSGETINSQGTAQIASFKRLQMADWILACTYPQSAAYLAAVELRYWLVAAAAIIMLVSSVLIWMLTGSVTANLNSFVDQVRDIDASAETNKMIRIDSKCEIGVLATAFNAMMSSLQEAHKALTDAAQTDPLTGLHNRRYLGEEAPKLLERARREKKSSAVLIVDADHFKQINDSYGHDAGDAVIRRIALVMTKTVRSYDLAIRYGGEEFLLLLPNVTAEEAETAAERLRCALFDNPMQYGPHQLDISVSIGIAVSFTPDLENLIQHADVALYEAKKSGRNCCRTITC